MPNPNWLDDSPKAKHRRKTQEFGKQREKKCLSLLSATPTSRSGAGRIKGDGRKKVGKKELHIEVKATSAKSFSITQRIWEKLVKECGYSRVPILMVEVSTSKGEKLRFIVTDANSFSELTKMDLPVNL